MSDLDKLIEELMKSKNFRREYLAVSLERLFTIDHLPKIQSSGLTYGDLLQKVYSFYFRSGRYQNEYYYKNTLFYELLVKPRCLNQVAALAELPVAGSRVDFVTIGDQGTAYEIKTDLDTFDRLKSQIDHYYKVFRYVNVVVGSKKVKKAKSLLKDTPVGILELTGKGKLIYHKKAEDKLDELSYEKIFKVLRKREFETIIKAHFHELPKVRDCEYYETCLRWLKRVNLLQFQEEAMQALKKRTLLKEDHLFYTQVPEELSFFAYFSKRYRLDYKTIHDFWHTTV